MRNWVGCKKIGVVGYTSSGVDIVCTTTGYTRLILLPVYTTIGYEGSDTDTVYPDTGYASNDIDIGCTTIGNIEFTALGTGQLGMPVPYTTLGFTYKKKQKTLT